MVLRLRQLQQSDKFGSLVRFGLKVLGALTGVLVLVVVGATLMLAITVGMDLRNVPNLSFLKHYHPVDAIEFYDCHDKLICTIEQDTNRKIVPLSDVPSQVQNAVLAAEDHHFYEHIGINPTSVVRALFANLFAGHVVEGGSTITQQLAKNLFFRDDQRTIDRKLAETFVAAELERLYSKSEILAMYLNEIYFGDGANGIEQAAWAYFGKDVSQLNIAESAFIAGLIKAPSIYGAPQNRKEALGRQEQVLDSMLACGFIDHNQYVKAKGTPLKIKEAEVKEYRPFDRFPYYISYVLEMVKHRYGNGIVRRHGLRVYTQMDQKAQQEAERVLSSGIAHAPKGINQGALVSIGITDGGIRSLVGGVGNYWDNQWNCATNPHTVGSAFKPFVYLTAFAWGIATPETIVEDKPLTIKQFGSRDYKPKNFDNRFLGNITVRKALALSRNVCAVRIAQKVDINRVISIARLDGITSDLPPNISLALGSCAVSPLEMANAYATFARGGDYMPTSFIKRVETLDGRLVEAFEAPAAHRIYPPEPVAELVDIMKDVVNYGTGVEAKLGDRPVAGKTGTADHSKDLWFIGFTPDMVTAVWGGCTDNLSLPGSHVTGGTVMARIWRSYNRDYYAEHPSAAGTLLASDGEQNDTNQEMKQSSHPRSKKRIIPLPNDVLSNYYYGSPNTRSANKITTRTYNPTGGMVVRAQQGINEYRWSGSR